jgi:hypothetical protein
MACYWDSFTFFNAVKEECARRRVKYIELRKKEKGKQSMIK